MAQQQKNGSPPVQYLPIPGSSGSHFGLALHHPLLYVTDFNLHCIDVVDLNSGQLRACWGSEGESKELGQHPQFTCPNGIVVDPDRQRLYVTDQWNNRIVVLKLADGCVEAVWGSQGGAQNQFIWPEGLSLSAGCLFVTDSQNYCVKVLNQDTGEFVREFGDGFGRDGAHMNQPADVALDGRYLYVADRYNHRVLVFNRHDESMVCQLGRGHGNGEGQFDLPAAVAVDEESGLLYVADSNNHRLQVWSTRDWSYVRQWAIEVPAEVGGEEGEEGGEEEEERRPDPKGLLWDAARRRLFVGLSRSKFVLIYNLESREIMK
eukprot:TRINITY_DN20787_c0_g3_i4.p1 TRINITY_DN20787_c0_g3~~TRINITY_DN20787_c0_g3_i4.p1  ORF type:complete len:336 (+),score=75.88 TRINITY_DN20787_c0_g3_i4:54-1010(+)